MILLLLISCPDLTSGPCKSMIPVTTCILHVHYAFVTLDARYRMCNTVLETTARSIRTIIIVSFIVVLDERTNLSCDRLHNV